MSNCTGTNTDNDRNRRRGIAVAFAFLVSGLYLAVPTVQAKAADRGAITSRGNVLYQEGKKEASIYAADFDFLKEKIDTIPEEVFDPVCYTHTHQWEYRDTDENTHTRHCGICGDAFDLKSVHSAVREEDYTIRHGNGEYPGRRYSCVCGWQWEQEASHVVVFEAVDEVNHQSRCLLADTAFCRGYKSVMEEHYAYRYDACEDGTHHMKSCIDCGYEDGAEECSFTLKPNPDDGDDRDPALVYCICGNGQAVGAGEEQTETTEDSPDAPPVEQPSESMEEQPEEESSESVEEQPGEEPSGSVEEQPEEESSESVEEQPGEGPLGPAEEQLEEESIVVSFHRGIEKCHRE